MRTAKIYKGIEKWGEIPFLAISIATLPVWFPILAIWVIVDPFYRIAMQKKINKSKGRSDMLNLLL